MLVSDGKVLGRYNFDLIDQVLDFLVTNHLKPFIDLGRRPNTAIRSQGNEIYYKEEYIVCESRKIWEDLVSEFMKEIVSRYGIEEVSTWIFEMTRDFYHKDSRLYEAENYDFFDAWKFTYRALRDIVPGAMFGGISSAIENDKEFAENFFKRCRKEQCSPDFISFFLYSYEIRHGLENAEPKRVLSINMALEKDRVHAMKNLMKETGQEECKLFISEWNNSIGNRNYLNDSCFRAAYLVAKTIDLWGETDMMAVMGGTDWVSSYLDTNKILNGGVGILTKDTIGKPALYALAFLKNMGTQFLAKGDNYLVTKKGNGDLYLLCHNFSWFRQNAYMNGDDVDLDKVRKIRYEDEQILELDFVIGGMPERGEYAIKKRSINKESGSILDEWGKLGYETRLNRDDIKYLQAISIPGIEMERLTTSPGRTLEVGVKLRPQEVALLHIYKV